MLRAALLIILVGISGYGLARAWPLVAGPSITLASPTQGGSYPEGIVHIEGVARRAALLTLNGSPLLHEPDGSFDITLAFASGGSILRLKATDRFGRTVSRTRSIFVP